jgi:biopolymer transport protein ExbD
LPTGQSGQTQDKQNYVSLSVDKDGFIYFDKEKINLEDVYPRLQKIYAENGDAKIFVRGDREALHGNVTRLLDQIRSSGFNKIAFEIKSQAGKNVSQPK